MSRTAVAVLALALLWSAAADAGRARSEAEALYRRECGACHLAYPPRFLPAESWRALMAGLADHFGEDASLDPDTAAAIEAYLVAHARTRRVRADRWPPLRISELRWFRHEHEEEVSPRAFRRAGTWANCGACHRDAERWRFDDD